MLPIGKHAARTIGRGEDWQDRAACGDEDPEMFFPVTSMGALSPQTVREVAKPALEVCDRCPVLTQCRRHAIATGQRDGIWGGLDEHQLRAVVREVHTRDEPDVRCGTPAGYAAHRRRGQNACGPCRAANAAQERERSARKRARTT